MATNDDQLLREQNLDPAEWRVASVTDNTWQGPSVDGVQTYKQRKIHSVKLRPLSELVLPARTDGVKFTAPKVKQHKSKSRLVAFVGDQHAPHHEKPLHEAFLTWLDGNQPDEIVCLGDVGDFPTVSRHLNHVEYTAKVQECVDGAYRLYRDYREHAPQARIRALSGNHDERLYTILLNQVPELYGLAKGSVADDLKREAVLGFNNLLRLDELAIELVEQVPKSNYEGARIQVTPDLVARHGTKAVRAAGQSAIQTLSNLTHSIVQGHSHRQALVPKTIYDGNGSRTIWAVEAGTMASLDLGSTYTSYQDWQQGFAVSTIYPDQTYQLELAKWHNDTLYWRDERLS